MVQIPNQYRFPHRKLLVQQTCRGVTFDSLLAPSLCETTKLSLRTVSLTGGFFITVLINPSAASRIGPTLGKCTAQLQLIWLTAVTVLGQCTTSSLVFFPPPPLFCISPTIATIKITRENTSYQF